MKYQQSEILKKFEEVSSRLAFFGETSTHPKNLPDDLIGDMILYMLYASANEIVRDIVLPMMTPQIIRKFIDFQYNNNLLNLSHTHTNAVSMLRSHLVAMYQTPTVDEITDADIKMLVYVSFMKFNEIFLELQK